MSFTWVSNNKSSLTKSLIKRTDIEERVQSVFLNTFQPEEHRKAWYGYLQAHEEVRKALAIMDISDLSLMLPPIEDYDIPLLQGLRESLQSLDAEAASYPYSAKSANDIKQLVMDYESCLAKEAKSNAEKIEIERKELEIEKKIKSTKREMLMNGLDRKNGLEKISALIVQKNQLKTSEESENCNVILEKLRRIFKARPSWKLRVKPSLFEDVIEAVSLVTENLKPNEPMVYPTAKNELLIIPPGLKGLPEKPWNNVVLKTSNSVVAVQATWDEFETWGTSNETKLQKALREMNVSLKASITIASNPVNGSVRCNIPWDKRFIWQEKIPCHSRMTLKDTPWVSREEDQFNVPKFVSPYAVRVAFKRSDNTIVPISNTVLGRDIERQVCSIAKRINFTEVLSEEDQARITRKAEALVLRGYVPGMDREQSVVLSFIQSGRWKYGEPLPKDLCLYLEPPQKKKMSVKLPTDLGAEYDVDAKWSVSEIEKYKLRKERIAKDFSDDSTVDILRKMNEIKQESLISKAKRSVFEENRKEESRIEKMFQERLKANEKAKELREKELENSRNKVQELLEAIRVSEEEQTSLEKDIFNLKNTIPNVEGDTSVFQKKLSSKEDELSRVKETINEKKSEVSLRESTDVDFLEEENKIRQEYENQKSKLEKKKEENAKNMGIIEDLIKENISKLTEDFLTGNIKTNDSAAPADLRFGGGYFFRRFETDPPLGMYVYKGQKLWTGPYPERTGDSVLLYNESNRKIEAPVSEIYPVLNDSIYLRDSVPTTNLQRLQFPNDSTNLKYFGYRELLSGSKEEVAYDMPYEIGTMVRVYFTNSDDIYGKVVRNLSGGVPNSTFTGFIHSVHICNASAISGMFKDGYKAMLVADVKITKSVIIKNIPFKCIEKVGLSSEVYYQSNGTFGTGKVVAQTIDDEVYVLNPRLKTINKSTNVLPIFEIDSNVRYEKNGDLKTGTIQYFSQGKYSILGDKYDMKEVSLIENETENKNSKWLKSKRIQNFLLFTDMDELKNHFDRYYTGDKMHANVFVDQQIEIGDETFEMNDTPLSVLVELVTDVEIITDKGNFSTLEINKIHVPIILNEEATEAITPSYNVQDLLVDETAWASDSSEDLSTIVKEDFAAWATDDESD